MSELCPIPTLLGLDVGLCDIIVEAGPSQGAGNPPTCCPRGLSIPSSVASWIPPANYFVCLSDASVSPFNLTLDSVSQPYPDSANTQARARTTLPACSAP